LLTGLQLEWSWEDPLKRYLFPLTTEPTWISAINRISSSTNISDVVMIQGPIAVGKSTFGRMLANHILTTRKTRSSLATSHPAAWSTPAAVYWLDLDPDKPEYTPPGQLSLVKVTSPTFGPAYTNSHAWTGATNCVVRAHHIGFHTPNEDPEHFLEIALALVATYRGLSSELKNGPLVVNPPRMERELGREVMEQLIKRIDPNYLVAIQPQWATNIDSENLPNGGRMLRLRAQPSLATYRSTAELRAMQTLTYFHQARTLLDKANWTPATITSMRPWILNYSKKKPDFLSFIVLGDKVPPQTLSIILEGCLVAIEVIDDLSAFSAYHESRETMIEMADSMELNRLDEAPATKEPALPPIFRTPKEKLPYFLSTFSGQGLPLSPHKSRCIGLGLIRKIDVARKEIHMVTPLHPEVCQQLDPFKTVLVRGRLDTPEWALLEEYYRRQQMQGPSAVSTKKPSSKTFGGVYDAPPKPPKVPETPWIERHKCNCKSTPRHREPEAIAKRRAQFQAEMDLPRML
jgi:polynucleotide 5'-hydroxyl-kinase GRC3/NOL9